MRDFGNRIDEISESVMGILTELENNESRDQFLKSIFINGLNLEIKKLVGLHEFATNNNCVQTALKAEKLITNRNPIFSNNNDREQMNSFPQSHRNAPHGYSRNNIICYYCRNPGHMKYECPQLNKKHPLLPNSPKNF